MAAPLRLFTFFQFDFISNSFAFILFLLLFLYRLPVHICIALHSLSFASTKLSIRRNMSEPLTQKCKSTLVRHIIQKRTRTSVGTWQNRTRHIFNGLPHAHVYFLEKRSLFSSFVNFQSRFFLISKYSLHMDSFGRVSCVPCRVQQQQQHQILLLFFLLAAREAAKHNRKTIKSLAFRFYRGVEA